MSLALHEFGWPDGPDLVLLHGLTEAGTTWPDAVRRWGSRFRILAPDLRGHGRSPRFTPAQLGDPMGVFLDDVVGLLEAVCRGPALLLGHSLGGRLALMVSASRPDLVDRLVLEDPALASVDTAPAGFAAQQHQFLDAFADGGVGERARMRSQTSWSAADVEAIPGVGHCVRRDDPDAFHGVVDPFLLGQAGARG